METPPNLASACRAVGVAAPPSASSRAIAWRGWLWGEAFFEDGPTSYWRNVIEADIRGPDPWDDGRRKADLLGFGLRKNAASAPERQRSHVLITPTDGCSPRGAQAGSIAARAGLRGGDHRLQHQRTAPVGRDAVVLRHGRSREDDCWHRAVHGRLPSGHGIKYANQSDFAARMLPRSWRLFRDTIRRVNRKDYSAGKSAPWAR